MVEIYDFEAAKARLRVKRAERSVERANELLNDETPGVCLRFPFAVGSDPNNGRSTKPNGAS